MFWASYPFSPQSASSQTCVSKVFFCKLILVLLHPSETTDAGYRIYNAKDLETLQQILFFKELDFPLSDIKEIMLSEGYDRHDTLIKHMELLVQKKKRLDTLIATLEAAIQQEHHVDFHAFDMSEFNELKEKYATEVKE